MNSILNVGTKDDGTPFELPADLGDKKIAMLAQSKKGKTYGLGVILEELEANRRLFIASDPASNLWGLRVLPDGSPSGLKVVIFGGPHADIPFEKDAGERVAELLLETPISAVIDVAFEDKNPMRRFMAMFSGRLMRTKPEIARVIVLEEGPEMIPQNPFGVQAQICKANVSKLATIGGNFGYGIVVACQRPATLDKDVLSQCEGLICLGITHKKDRTTIKEWMEAKDIEESAAAAFAELGSLKPGEAWYWNPSEERFERFTFRRRHTLHPREMQKLGLKAGAVQLGDMQAFVERAKRDLTKTTVGAEPPKIVKSARAIAQMAKNPELKEVLLEANAGVSKALGEMQIREQELRDQLSRLLLDHGKLKSELQSERQLRKGSEERLKIARDLMKPQYDVLKRLFEELGEASAPSGRGEVGAAWTPWLEKAPSENYRTVLSTLVKSGRLKKLQLATLCGIQFGGTTWRRVHAWLVKNSLVISEGDVIEAVEL